MHLGLELVNILRLIAGWSSLAARRAHNPKVVGSNPAPATSIKRKGPVWGFLLIGVGHGPTFYLCVRFMKRHIALEAVIAPVIIGLGYEFVGLEYLPQGKHSVLRLYIDRPEGVSIEDCAKVSHQVSSVLEVETQVVRGEYALEVSSPGVDRKIFTLEQFPKFIGRTVHITVNAVVNGQRNFKGTLSAVNGTELLLDINGAVINVDVANIAQANVIDEKARL